MTQMPATKIRYSPDDWEFIQKHKEATGMSIQKFTETGVKLLRVKIEADTYLNDLHYQNEPKYNLK